VGKVFPVLLISDFYCYKIYLAKSQSVVCFIVTVLHVCPATANSTVTHFAADVGSVCDKDVELRDAIKGTRSLSGISNSLATS